MDLELKELAELLARFIVDHPERIRVKEIGNIRTSIIQLRAATDDLPRIIGRGGENAEALRTILSAVAAKLKKRCFLEVVRKPDFNI
jgi:predicted RNA-binding protein YlqC (UPF0109 family)